MRTALINRARSGALGWNVPSLQTLARGRLLPVHTAMSWSEGRMVLRSFGTELRLVVSATREPQRYSDDCQGSSAFFIRRPWTSQYLVPSPALRERSPPRSRGRGAIAPPALLRYQPPCANRPDCYADCAIFWVTCAMTSLSSFSGLKSMRAVSCSTHAVWPAGE